jgi:hypothetical protein
MMCLAPQGTRRRSFWHSAARPRSARKAPRTTRSILEVKFLTQSHAERHKEVIDGRLPAMGEPGDDLPSQSNLVRITKQDHIRQCAFESLFCSCDICRWAKWAKVR